MSRLIDIDLQVQPESEPEGYEFGYYTFDTLPALEVSNVETSQDTSLNVNDTDVSNNVSWKLPISNDTLSKLQEKDMFCNNIESNRKRKYNKRTVICSERQIGKEICHRLKQYV